MVHRSEIDVLIEERKSCSTPRLTGAFPMPYGYVHGPYLILPPHETNKANKSNKSNTDKKKVINGYCEEVMIIETRPSLRYELEILT